MTVADTVNRVFREFKRYTGDGLPGEPSNAPLPVGDPSSGVQNPKKSEIRTALTDVLEGAEAAQDGAEAAQVAAELARDQAQAAASSVSPTEYPTIADAEALAPVSAPDFIRTAGYTAAGDGGGALYKKVVSEPSHIGKFSVTLDDAVTVVWYEIAEKKPNLRQFGAIPGVDDAPSAAANVAAVAAAIAYGSYFEGTPETYYFGTWTGDTYLFTTDHDLAIDWKGAHIIVDGDDATGTTSTYFLVAEDARISMWNYEFTDRSYDIDAPGVYRGVGPVGIVNDAANTSGYSFGNFIIHKGQSLLTVASLNPDTARASDISFFGNCQGVETYYGVNLANNGDGFQGDYKLGEVDRAAFIYGIDGFQSRIQVRKGVASSANLMLKHYGRDLRNVDIDIAFTELNGPINIEAQTDEATPGFHNIKIVATIKTAGANLPAASWAPMRIRQYTAAGVEVTTGGDIALDGIVIDLRAEPDYVRAIDCFVESPNIDPITLRTNLPWQPTIGENTSIKLLDPDGRGVTAAAVVVANSGTLNLPIGALRRVPSALRGRLLVNINAYGEPSPPAGGRTTSAEYSVRVSVSSDGTIGLINAEQIWQKDYGSITPTITVSASAGDITVTATGMGADSTNMEVLGELRLLN